MKPVFLSTVFTILAIMSFLVFVQPYTAAASPQQIKNKDWYTEAWNYFEEKGTFAEVSNQAIDPNETITRGEFAAFLFEALNIAPAKEVTSSFTDIEQVHPYFTAIMTLSNHNIIHGYNDRTFKPHASLTRAEMAVILSNAYSIKSNTELSSPFHDVTPQHWAYEDICKLYQANILNGQAKNTFAPNEQLTWAEVVQGIYNATQYNSTAVAGYVSDSDVQITDIVVYSQNGRYLEISFSQPLETLKKSQLHIYETASGDTHGIQNIELIEGGTKALVTLFEGAEIDTLTEYTVVFTINENKSVYSLYRNEYHKINDVQITGVDIEDREITITDSNDEKWTFDVPSAIEMDFVNAYNRNADVWYNSNGELTLYEITNPDEKVKDNFIKQYDLNDFLLITSINNGIAKGINGEVDLDHFEVYVKSNQMIKQESIQPGDFILFNDEDKVVQVSTNIVTGEVAAVYQEGIKVGDAVYDYNGYILPEDDDDLEHFDADITEDLEDREVTLYLDNDDEIVYVQHGDSDIKQEN